MYVYEFDYYALVLCIEVAHVLEDKDNGDAENTGADDAGGNATSM